MASRAMAVLVVLLLTAAGSATQEAATTFDVVSIKRSPPNATTSMRRLPDGQFVMTNRPLVVLLRSAWPDYFDVSGMPSWMNTEMYDVIIRPPAEATAAQRQQMYRNLLATRMKLAVHFQPKEVPSFALVLDRKDGRLGPKLRPSTLGCDGTTGQPPLDADTRRWAATAAANCDLQFWNESTVGRMVSGGALLDQLARQLGQSALSRPVTNETNLQGRYAIDLRFWRAVNTNADNPSDAPEVRTALQDQLGLKIQASTTPVQILVIDHVERPSEN